MTDISSGPLRGLIRKLASPNHLDERAKAAIAELPYRRQTAKSGTTITREGDHVAKCCLLVEGYACRFKWNDEGARQIVSFHMAGDILDVQHLLFERADHHVEAITQAELAFIPMAALRALAKEYEDIGIALWRDCLVEASVFREWVLNVGRRDAKKRIAHMLCELAVRAEVAGLGSRECFILPMTQQHIADATGLTSIHVNRMLRTLTEEGAISRNGREIRIADWSKMRRTAHFSADYLHLAA